MLGYKKIICGFISFNILIGCIFGAINVKKVFADTVNGDVNCDGMISLDDVIKMRRYFLSQSNLSSSGLINADIDNNGKVNVLDMILTTKILLEYDEKLASLDMPDPLKDEKKCKIAYLINQKRLERGLTTAILDTKLSYVADIRASELAIVFQLARPDGRPYRSLLSEYRLYELSTYQYIMEDYRTAQDIVDGITEGEAFLDDCYKKMGIGFYRNSSDYCVIFFTS